MARILILLQFACMVALRASDIPFRFEHGLIWIEVSTERGKTLQFLVDTGATVSVLDAATARELRLRRGGSVAVAGVGTQVTGYWPSRLRASAGEVRLPAKYLVLGLSELSESCRCHIDGLLGADFFKGKVVEFDFRSKRLRVHSKAPDAGETDIVLPLRTGSKGSLLTQVRVDRQPGWVRVDTGFAGSLDWVKSGGPVSSKTKRVSVGLAQVTSSIVPTEVALGEMLLPETPTGFHAKPIFPGESGLLGNTLLSRFSVILDQPHGRLLLKAPGESMN